MEGDAVTLASNHLAAAQRLAMLRNAKREIEAEEKEARDELLAAMTSVGATVGLDDDGNQILTITPQLRRTVNRAKLEAMYPEVFETVVEDKESLIVKVMFP